MRPDVQLNQALARELSAVEQKLSGRGDIALPDREKLLPCSVAAFGTLHKAVDVYNGPNGKGFVLRLIYEQDGKSWMRRVTRGPQGFRSSEWQLVTVPKGK